MLKSPQEDLALLILNSQLQFAQQVEQDLGNHASTILASPSDISLKYSYILILASKGV